MTVGDFLLFVFSALFCVGLYVFVKEYKAYNDLHRSLDAQKAKKKVVVDEERKRNASDSQQKIKNKVKG